jgi:glutathione peroxidase
MTAPIWGFRAIDINGDEVSLADYTGQVLLIVNTASECGFTSQYEGLEQLQRRYAGRGFTVLAFPCDQFGGQEPGTDVEIRDFCQRNFAISFPLFAKVEVNGTNTHPLYRYLKAEARGVLGSESIKWNFTKFLIDREGRAVTRYAPATKPEALAADIEALL